MRLGASVVLRMASCAVLAAGIVLGKREMATTQLLALHETPHCGDRKLLACLTKPTNSCHEALNRGLAGTDDIGN